MQGMELQEIEIQKDVRLKQTYRCKVSVNFILRGS